MPVYRRPASPDSNFYSRTIAAQLHAVGVLLIIFGGWRLLPAARAMGPEHFWSLLVFLVTGGFVFLTSSTYHFLHDGFTIAPSLEAKLENLDHYCIYLFIAGTHTPVILNAVIPPWRERLLLAVWGFAIFGIAYTKWKKHLPEVLQRRWLYTLVFILMGWTMMVRFQEVYAYLTVTQRWLLFLGALSYSLGAVSYVTKRPRLFEGRFGYHELWHVMVLAGATAHYFVIRLFYLH